MKDKLRKKYIVALLVLGMAWLSAFMAMISGDFKSAVDLAMIAILIWLVLDHVEISANLEAVMEYLNALRKECDAP